jgi:hypothetical protein
LKLKYIYGFRLLNSMKFAAHVATVMVLLALMPLASAEDRICAVYITGIGCPNCGATDPVITSGLTAKNPDYLVIEYEIYHRNADNYPTAEGYFNTYVQAGVQHGVPFLILNTENYYIGRYEVLGAESVIEGMASNGCPMPDGSSVGFGNLDISTLSGKPNVWAMDRVLVSEGGGGGNELLKNLLFEEDIAGLLGDLGYEEVSPVPVQLSGSQAEFEHAVRLDGWVFQWNGEGLNGGPVNNGGNGSNAQNAASLYSIAAILVIIFIGLIVYFTRFR